MKSENLDCNYREVGESGDPEGHSKNAVFMTSELGEKKPTLTSGTWLGDLGLLPEDSSSGSVDNRSIKNPTLLQI